MFLFTSFCPLAAVCQSEDRRGGGGEEKMGCRTLHLLVIACAAAVAAGEIDLGE